MRTRASRAHIKKAKDKRQFFLERQDYKCAYCECKLDLVGDNETRRATLDHVIPRSEGGPNHESNLVVACGPCNQAKGDMPLKEFITKKDQPSS